MVALSEYGQAVAATTLALEQLLASALSPAPVTARTPDSARIGVAGTSVNVFLYADDFVRYRSGSDPVGTAKTVGAELHYLVSAHPAHDADTDAASQRAYGTTRAAIERHPVLPVSLGSDTMSVQLTAASFTLPERAALWSATQSPLRLSFELTARFALDASDRAPVGTVRDVVTRANGGLFVVFSGPDVAAKREAATSVARELNRPLLDLDPAKFVSKYIGETEKNLEATFASAEGRDWVLFFDEGDALFGKRTAVRDSHDRYADVAPQPILDMLARAPSVVIFALAAEAGEDLAGRASLEVRFPPG
jgi:hypothetical protein